ncbi:MAG TPA: hypothetical protein VMG09_03785 [Bacteroidota bacterium]|nr:hypothetical protein [Bacteroidota bacterium]
MPSSSVDIAPRAALAAQNECVEFPDIPDPSSMTPLHRNARLSIAAWRERTMVMRIAGSLPNDDPPTSMLI